jgi:3-(methylthio)propanoyl-CoA dehydrogenase
LVLAKGTMANFLDDNADLQYYLGKGIDWDTIASLAEAGYRQPDGFRSAAEALAFYKDVTSAVGAFAATEVAPYAAEIDRQGVGFKDGEAGRLPAPLGRDLCQGS